MIGVRLASMAIHIPRKQSITSFVNLQNSQFVDSPVDKVSFPTRGQLVHAGLVLYEDSPSDREAHIIFHIIPQIRLNALFCAL